MLSKNVQIVDLDPFQYENAVTAFSAKPSPWLKIPTLIVFYHENRLVHAVHTVKGPLNNVNFRGPRNLDQLANEHSAGRVICLETGALRRVASNAQARLRYDQQFWDQILACKAAAKTEMGSGIHIHPDPFKALPRLPDFALKIVRLFLPRRVLVSAVVFDGDGIWTSLIAGADSGEISLITSTDSLEPLDVRSMNMKAKVDRVNRRVAERWGRPTAGFYMERVAYEQLVTAPNPLNALARLVAGRWIIVKPFPQRLKVLLSILKLFKLQRRQG